MDPGLDEVLGQQWGDPGLAAPPTSPLHHPIADGRAGGAGERPVGVRGGRKEEKEFAGLKREDQRPIFNCSFECEVSPMLKKAPGKWWGRCTR